jgi:hypothetical protein
LPQSQSLSSVSTAYHQPQQQQRAQPHPDWADKLERLENILPTANRQDLRAALDKAGGDEVLAVSVYLSDEKR